MKSKTFFMMGAVSLAAAAMLIFTQAGCKNGKENPKPNDNSNIPELPGYNPNEAGKNPTEPSPAKKDN